MRPTLEVADIFRRHGPAYVQAHGGRLGRVERRVMSAVELCRTAELGGHVEGCRACGVVRVAHNSCRNRHFPKCQGAIARDWLAARAGDLLPVPYFHVVFTLPTEIAPIAFQNKEVVYGILFRTAAETLRIIAADPRHLGAGIGLIAVLHSWGQTISYHPHPHLHCIVPGGGPSPDGTRWIASRPGFFLPVRVLSRLFRRLFVQALRAAFAAEQLRFFGDIAERADPQTFARRLTTVQSRDWVVCGCPRFCKKYLTAWGRSFAVVCQASDVRLFSRRGPVWFVRGSGPNRLRGLLAPHPLLAFRSRLPSTSISFEALLTKGHARIER